jgi:hypothetical protein
MRPRLFDPRYQANSFSFQIDSVATVKWRNRALFKQLALNGGSIARVLGGKPQSFTLVIVRANVPRWRRAEACRTASLWGARDWLSRAHLGFACDGTSRMNMLHDEAPQPERVDGESQRGFRLAKHITQRSTHGLMVNFFRRQGRLWVSFRRAFLCDL